MEKVNVLIVEDQMMPRQLFELFIESSERFQLFSSTDSGELAIEIVDKNPIDLVIMDVVINGEKDGLDTAMAIKSRYPKIKIIIVTSMPEYSYIEQAKKIGVDSFWYKELSKDPILAVMEKTMDGENIYPDNTPKISLGFAQSNDFTDREIEVLREITAGLSNIEIAEKLHMSLSTVKTHIQSMFDKTGFKNRVELAIEAIKIGIVVPKK